MQHDQKQLHEIAQNNPCYMFTVEEIALLCNVSRDVISKVRGAVDSPFFMNKCRPEWVLEWMRVHPGFQLTKDPLPPTTVTTSPIAISPIKLQTKQPSGKPAAQKRIESKA